ncbi:PqqD family protein [Croceicoccus sp. F390]|uniref:PqqD family protein n=1 Tax=Croceicoccus esteveae TaxID=3075597 RepID=A0ABU2ZK96_9SPHN|nr:PqqD family protein [Croceicoccus sp. F390]MDT0577029.1 PqqD family protein [Croceicoccus sp. F390]
MSILSVRTKVTACENVVACELSTGSALLNLDTSRYFQLNGTASFLWDSIGEGNSVQGLCDAMAANYAVEVDDCYDDVIALLEAFRKAKLITIAD